MDWKYPNILPDSTSWLVLWHNLPGLAPDSAGWLWTKITAAADWCDRFAEHSLGCASESSIYLAYLLGSSNLFTAFTEISKILLHKIPESGSEMADQYLREIVWKPFFPLNFIYLSLIPDLQRPQLRGFCRYPRHISSTDIVEFRMIYFSEKDSVQDLQPWPFLPSGSV